MSRENVETAKQFLDAVERRDLARLIALTDPEVEWHSMFAELGEGGVYRGHAGLARYVNDLSDAFESTSVEIDDEITVGSVVLLVGHLHYRGRESGIESESAAGWMFKFRDERLLRCRAFREPENVLEAAGLSKQDAHADS
jgi:ketosteroid isomerase-like protein